MLVTSNRTVGEWGSVFGDAVVATAILDRLLHHSHVLTIRGDNYRLREKRRRGLLQRSAPTPEIAPVASELAPRLRLGQTELTGRTERGRGRCGVSDAARPQMFLMRGITFSYEAVREWEAKLTPILIDNLRRRRGGRIGRSWYVDETYIKVQSRWCYLYRAIDRSGALVDVRLSETRDMAAAKAFFRSARTVTGIVPARVTTDGHDSYPRAIRTELGQSVKHRTNRYLNNRIEQSHRGIKGRYGPMRGFKSHGAAVRFCRGYDELRNFLGSYRVCC